MGRKGADVSVKSIAGPNRVTTDPITAESSLLEARLREAVDQLPPALRLISGYHFGWWDAAEKPVAGRGGKAMRAALVLTSAEAVGGSAQSALPAAVAVELVHNFSLLHDDVMDNDRTRRGRPAAWTVFGPSAAILAGDAMLALATNVVASADEGWSSIAVGWLSQSVVELCEGQSDDLAFEKATTISRSRCERMVAGKTASLISVSCALGALAGEAGADRIEALRDFGRHLGMAFQFVDDLLGIWGDPLVTGKPAGADLMHRKKSLPVVAALTSGTEAGAELDRVYRSAGPVDPAVAAELVECAGGRRWAAARADEELASALSRLTVAGCEEAPTTRLIELAHRAVRRTA
ncbi:polyprenyl synthetase family protein [Amycolatopsis japonica]|uniref:polyprenyl synthetase family protein n=1 Tax=Amycolatopsis japonica TaxID=208439 RepID=UPI003672F055